jgi:hypothetical protein
MKRKVAENISQLMLEFSERLNESILLVQDEGNLEDTLYYKKVIAKIMGEMLIEILNPIYSEHPDLKPFGLK